MSKKILLVEDEALIALNEAQMLQHHGYEVVTAYNGEKAVELVNNDPDISLILMDIDLGKGMNGTEAAEEILEKHDLPIAFLSSRTEPEVVAKTEGITSYGYIVKNSGETVLLSSIRMAFRLWESEDKFRKAFEYSSVGMVLTSPSGELLQINEAFASMLGYSPAEILSVNCSKLTHPEDIEISVDRLKKMIEGKTDRGRFTKRYIRKDGVVVWADINTMLLRDSERKPLRFVTHVQDISESKIMQEELDQQREQYNLLLRSAPTPILVMQDDKYVYSNPCAAALLGYPSSRELIGTPIRQTIAEDSLMRIEDRMKKLESGGKNHAEEITILRRDGKTLCCESTSIPITFNSSPAALIIGRDLTAQKQVETALKESRDKIASILKAAPTGIGVVQGRKKRTIVEANEKLCRMTGYSRDELIGMPARLLYPSQEDFDYVGSEKYRQIDEQGSGRVETRWKKKNGTVIEVLLASSPIHPSDISLGVTFTAMDITTSKHAEKDLREKEALYRNLMENSSDAVYLLNETGKILQVNHTACKMLGYSKRKLLQLTIDDVDPNYPSKRFIEFWNDKPEGATVLFETIHRHKDGKEIPVEVNGIFFILDGKKYLFGVSRNITERRQAEEALRESVLRFDEMVARIPVGIYITWLRADGSMKFEYVSDRWCAIHKLRREDVIADAAAANNQVHPDEREVFFERNLEAFRSHTSFLWEGRFIVGDGNLRWLRIESNPTVFENGDIRWFGVTHDITDRKQAEEKLRKTLKEKDFLMKELNHRVKNNLAMVSSLISLKDSEAEADLSDIRHQIEAISLIHEKLYRTGNVTEIVFQDYISDLLNSIFSSFSRRPVRIEANIAEISIPTKSAMSLGLIINEIATNAIKHGFNGKEEALFSVDMKEDRKNNRYELTLSNTGDPFPADIDVEDPQTLGLRLISALTEQLGGTMDLKRETRPVFIIRFPAQGSTYKNSAGRPAK